MNLLLNTHGTEDLECCNWAFLNLDGDLCKTILHRRDIMRQLAADDPSLTTMEYCDTSIVFLDALPEKFGDAESVGLSDETPFVERADAAVEDFENAAARTECDRMVIGVDEVYWSAYPTHVDQLIESCGIDYRTVEIAAREAL